MLGRFTRAQLTHRVAAAAAASGTVRRSSAAVTTAAASSPDDNNGTPMGTKSALCLPVDVNIPLATTRLRYVIPKSDPRAVELLEGKRSELAVFLSLEKKNNGPVQPPALSKLSKVGMLTQVDSLQSISDDLLEVKVVGLQRIVPLSTPKLAERGTLVIDYEPLKEFTQEKREEALKLYLLDTAEKCNRDCLISLCTEKTGAFKQRMIYDYSLAELTDKCFGFFSEQLPPSELQAVLSEPEIGARAKLVIRAIKQLDQFSDLEDRANQLQANGAVQNEVEESKLQTDILSFLNFSSESKVDIAEDFEKKISAIESTHPKIAKSLRGELSKFKNLDSSSSDYHVSRNYLELATSLPWNKFSEDNADLKSAQKILDEDHFGLPSIKDRILEFMAVCSLSGNVQGKILCFAGPPGVGKTSIASSIAKALGKQFYRVSVGGLDDVTELKGHRRTYIGALPGRIIQALKACQTANPVILIDEIDKLCGTHKGDPGSALLEILDPSQNEHFTDTYLDLPFDLSKVLFLATANDLGKISGPLYDRMEVLELNGYVTGEKVEIAKRHIIPKTLKECGLSSEQVSFDDTALVSLAESYCDEPGVRNLQRFIEKILRQIAYRVSLTPGSSKDLIIVDKANLTSFVGKPSPSELSLESETPPGYIVGLYASGSGGGCLPIETIIVGDGKGEISVTGNLKTVITESTSVGLSFCKKFLEESGDTESLKNLENRKLHLHFPGLDIQKDGPSAGIAIVTSFMSLAKNKPARTDVAMTGEVSLNGKVLAIGGVQSKCLGALREGIRKVILPKQNERDWTEVPEEIKKEMEVFFVSDYSEVYDIMFNQKITNEVIATGHDDQIRISM
eukprot:TRINITY_DN73799_c0_g1_i1.p1 TRINITY_DN73799_c0_g1~~TRINITY_DN73799_c0_g1_i1.p1  ORF type:complete len:851 (+),score=202.56 TRINITY_DN73799_c0_g1_i1:2514-5066(+)